MSVLNQIRNRVEIVRTGLQSELVRNVLMKHENDILDLQKLQLLQGKASSGDDLRPYYSEDLKSRGGYFKSAETAGRYSAWKEGLSYPYSVQRNPDAPNLYINGKFHSELGVQYNPESVAVVGETSYANQIIEKYGMGSFGLMRAYWDVVFREKGALGELITEIRRILIK